MLPQQPSRLLPAPVRLVAPLLQLALLLPLRLVLFALFQRLVSELLLLFVVFLCGHLIEF